MSPEVGGPRALRPTCEVAIQNPVGWPAGRVKALAAWLAPVITDLAPEAASVGVCLAEDAALRRASRRYRGRDRATDVLSFPGERTVEGWHLGDVLISLPKAERQARRLGHSLERELRELLLHGVLHCLGHDHERDDGEMAALELRLRSRWLPEGGI